MVLLTGCGSSTTAPSGITNRAFITNSYGGAAAPTGEVEIVNASNDALAATSNLYTNSSASSTISAGEFPTLMALSPAREVTMVYGSGGNTVAVITNSTESGSRHDSLSGQLSGAPGSMLAQNASTGFAAIPNENTEIAGSQQLGALVVLDLATNFNVTNTIYVPSAHSLVMNPAASKLLVFSTRRQLSRGSRTPPCSARVRTDGFRYRDQHRDPGLRFRPCRVGGIQQRRKHRLHHELRAGMRRECRQHADAYDGQRARNHRRRHQCRWDSGYQYLAGATVGLLNGSTLYVGTGYDGIGRGNGTLTILDVSGATPGGFRELRHWGGYHTLMALGANNKLFIGATSCTNGTGCLSIFDTSANTAAMSSAKGNVTGIAPIANRNVVYVCEGPPGVGQFHIYYTTAATPTFSTSIDIVGNAVDVKTIDQ